MNNADRVKVACLAQLVNVIGAIMTEERGPAWRQTIFYPFAQASQFARGKVLRTRIQTDSYASGFHTQLDFLLASVLHDESNGRATVFALNRSPTQEMKLTVELRGLGKRRILHASQLHHPNLKAENTRAAPDTVKPTQHRAVSTAEGRLHAHLLPHTWNVFVTEPD